MENTFATYRLTLRLERDSAKAATNEKQKRATNPTRPSQLANHHNDDSIASITQLTEYIHPLQALFEKCKEVFTPEEAGSIEKLVLDKMICPWWIILVREWDVLDDVVNRAKRHCEEWKKLLPQISKRCSGDDREETEKRCKKAWKSLNEAEEMLGDVTRLGHLLTM